MKALLAAALLISSVNALADLPTTPAERFAQAKALNQKKVEAETAAQKKAKLEAETAEIPAAEERLSLAGRSVIEAKHRDWGVMKSLGTVDLIDIQRSKETVIDTDRCAYAFGCNGQKTEKSVWTERTAVQYFANASGKVICKSTLDLGRVTDSQFKLAASANSPLAIECSANDGSFVTSLPDMHMNLVRGDKSYGEVREADTKSTVAVATVTPEPTIRDAKVISRQ